MSELIESATQAIRQAVEQHETVALCYSGGLESSLLLRLCHEWRDSILVLTVRTGAEFPHMIEFIDRQLADYQHEILRSNVMDYFQKVGYPANAIPLEHVPGVECMVGRLRQPRIVHWIACCDSNRWEPMRLALKYRSIKGVLHGQRAGDFPGERQPLSLADNVATVAPLWNSKRSEVVAAVEQLGIALPDHYAEFPSSLDCSICPASLSTARRAFMRRRYLAYLGVAEDIQAQISGAVMQALVGDETIHNHRVS